SLQGKISSDGCLKKEQMVVSAIASTPHCIEAKMLPADLMTRRAAIIMRGYISGLMENWLFAPQSFDLKKEARDYVAILLEMYLLCPTLRNPATNE
ncbi:hypothetical protein LIY55_15990, partial [Escherichia coli]|nr:hypothetical protein [Escherichia coli]MCB6833119.1 hypothetical protein [Escherichia coli]